jgi:EmrB/QacA subfamily drug resistance transporter
MNPGALSATPAAGLRRLFPHPRAVAIVYGASMFMSVMDTQIVNVALPTMAHDFHVSIPSVQWVVTVYLMSIAVCVPASGWLGDRFGSKKIYLIAVGSFTAASLLCAMASNLPELVVTRILQGAGGGMMVPVGMSMLYRAYPPDQRIGVARLITRVSVIAPATAPIIGGSLVTWESWRWIFTINIPVGVAALVFGSFFLHEHSEPRRGGFDLPGAILGGAGLGLLLFSVGSGPTLGWASAEVDVTGIAAVVTVTGFVLLELHREHPLLNLHLLSNRLFRQCCSIIAFSSTSFFGSLVFTSLYLQEGRGLSAIDAGLSTFPEAIAIGITSQIVARLFPKVGPRRLLAAGFTGLALTCGALARAGDTTSLWEIRGLCFALGVFVAFIMLPSQTSAFAQITPAETGHASAIFNTLQRALASLGVALLATVLALGGGDVVRARPSMSAFHWVFAANVALATTGAVLSLRIRDRDAASAMGARRPPVKSADSPTPSGTVVG